MVWPLVAIAAVGLVAGMASKESEKAAAKKDAEEEKEQVEVASRVQAADLEEQQAIATSAAIASQSGSGIDLSGSIINAIAENEADASVDKERLALNNQYVMQNISSKERAATQRATSQQVGMAFNFLSTAVGAGMSGWGS